jgi:hypothetical protein
MMFEFVPDSGGDGMSHFRKVVQLQHRRMAMATASTSPPPSTSEALLVGVLNVGGSDGDKASSSKGTSAAVMD